VGPYAACHYMNFGALNINIRLGRRKILCCCIGAERGKKFSYFDIYSLFSSQKQ
jgi:hypothetical protein